MDVVRARSLRFVSSLPVRLYRALPSVILGTLFNVLDTVSTGILVFPSEDGAFGSLQLQGLAMYIMSTLTSQLVMTFGGSRFPGAMGAMLIEILPFLRGVATDIRAVLGDDHPGLIPTVMAAYVLTSFLTGAAFVFLGILKLGNLVAYFPQTVLTGAIGAIGVSLFVLGLGLPFPSSATPLSLSNVASTLFSKNHLSLLAASFFPAFFLSVSVRSRHIELWTRGLIRSPYYIPVYLLMIPTVFWIVAPAAGISRESLMSAGWLFTVDTASVSSSSGLVASWNYWALFEFRLVEWWSLKSAIKNIVLLVVIGVLNLPIYVPTLAFSLDVSYDMNHELIGQGVANIFAGLVGTVPNILQYSYSVYVTRAKGGRFELALVSALTAALFLCSGLLLPYVPTILASALVLFLGIELFLEAIWEASKTLAWMEYIVVLATLGACTFLGFAEGFGVGIGAAAAVYLMYGVIDSPARVTRWNEWNELQQLRTQDNDHVAVPIEGRLPPRNHTLSPITLDPPRSTPAPSLDVKAHDDSDVLQQINARVVVLSGYIFFASVPSLERALLASPVPAQFFILDLTHGHRIETAAARVFLRCVRELKLKDSMLVVCGVRSSSGLHSDFVRAEVPLVFDSPDAASLTGSAIAAFETRAVCLAWCQQEHESRLRAAKKPEGLDDQAKEDAFIEFCRLFGFELNTVLGPCTPEDSPTLAQTSLAPVQHFTESGGRVDVYLPGQAIRKTGTAFLIEGQIDLVAVPSSAEHGVLRPSVQRLLSMVPRETLRAVRARLPSFSRGGSTSAGHLKAGDVLDCRTPTDVAVARTRSIVVGMEGEKLAAWAQANFEARTRGRSDSVEQP
ncbi:sulfate transporter family-domain-containing protein [Mycena albidolilacea]|uniref:Sulfate transporter family-domain-containing protein n=1 Tax=Mycena albidolilacea TaxID=1033008 RepID=A0AAD7A0U5_9AGAR|nr:sulfate transporter family-domain-containing protein [Mycena albidolilacea]